MEHLGEGLGFMFILLGLAVLFQGWPSFITHNHYYNKKEEEDGE